MKTIPLFKVKIAKTADREVLKTLHSGYIAEGGRVREFTKAVSRFLGNPYVVPVSSCTMALTIAYELAGIKRGDEVISTPLTCVATNTPLVQLGARIVWADCERDTGMIDPEKLESLITRRTKAVVVLHKDGDLAKMDAIRKVARKYKLAVIEDAAHVFGARYRGKRIGTVGDYACFSFQAIKHITTGDGGALVVKTKADYKKAKKYKWFGIDKEAPRKHRNPWMEDISVVGYKGNMNDIAATLGISQMRGIKRTIDQYHENGEFYSRLLKGAEGVALVPRDPKNYPVYWVYTLLVEKRGRVMKALKKAGIASGVIHPRNDVYSMFRKSKRLLPGVDYYAKRELSVPCGPWVTKSDIRKIVKVIRENAV